MKPPIRPDDASGEQFRLALGFIKEMQATNIEDARHDALELAWEHETNPSDCCTLREAYLLNPGRRRPARAGFVG